MTYPILPQPASFASFAYIIVDLALVVFLLSPKYRRYNSVHLYPVFTNPNHMRALRNPPAHVSDLCTDCIVKNILHVIRYRHCDFICCPVRIPVSVSAPAFVIPFVTSRSVRGDCMPPHLRLYLHLAKDVMRNCTHETCVAGLHSSRRGALSLNIMVCRSIAGAHDVRTVECSGSLLSCDSSFCCGLLAGLWQTTGLNTSHIGDVRFGGGGGVVVSIRLATGTVFFAVLLPDYLSYYAVRSLSASQDYQVIYLRTLVDDAYALRNGIGTATPNSNRSH